jgi:hypothetical protein
MRDGSRIPAKGCLSGSSPALVTKSKHMNPEQKDFAELIMVGLTIVCASTYITGWILETKINSLGKDIRELRKLLEKREE